MMVEYQKTVKYFGENVATTRIDDFFAIFAGFIKDFEASCAFLLENKILQYIKIRMQIESWQC